MVKIVSHPDICGGTPCIEGTRIPARAVMSFHDDGYSVAHIQSEYPTLSEDTIRSVIAQCSLYPHGTTR